MIELQLSMYVDLLSLSGHAGIRMVWYGTMHHHHEHLKSY